MVKVLCQSPVLATEKSIYLIDHGHLVQFDRKTLGVKRFSLGVFTAGIKTNIELSGNALIAVRKTVNPYRVSF